MGEKWSGRVDLNHRPSEPHSDTLPDCATPRHDVLKVLRELPPSAKPVKNKHKFERTAHKIRPCPGAGHFPLVLKVSFKYVKSMIRKTNIKICRLTGELIALFFVLVFLQAAPSHADIYKYEDADGVIHLTNVPSNSKVKYVMLVREKRIIFSPNINVREYDKIIAQAASKFNLDASLIKAVIKAESNFNHRALSPAGAKGLMQLMPKTATALNVNDVFHPENNIEGGARYLRYLLNLYKGNLTLALAAYNAGEGAVAKYNYGVPPYRETQNYVRRVLDLYQSYSKL